MPLNLDPESIKKYLETYQYPPEMQAMTPWQREVKLNAILDEMERSERDKYPVNSSMPSLDDLFSVPPKPVQQNPLPSYHSSGLPIPEKTEREKVAAWWNTVFSGSYAGDFPVMQSRFTESELDEIFQGKGKADCIARFTKPDFSKPPVIPKLSAKAIRTGRLDCSSVRGEISMLEAYRLVRSGQYFFGVDHANNFKTIAVDEVSPPAWRIGIGS